MPKLSQYPGQLRPPTCPNCPYTQKQGDGNRWRRSGRTLPRMSDSYPCQPIAGARGDHEAFATVRHAQAVLVVVSSGSAPRGQNAGKRTIRRRRCGGFIRLAGVDRLAVLGANPVRDKRHMGKGEHLREHKQAADARTSPSPGFHGPCSQGKRARRHVSYLTPQFDRVKARGQDQRGADRAEFGYWQ
jgi:hypothetical protein